MNKEFQIYKKIYKNVVGIFKLVLKLKITKLKYFDFLFQLGTHIRAKRKREEMQQVIAQQRKAAAAATHQK